MEQRDTARLGGAENQMTGVGKTRPSRGARGDFVVDLTWLTVLGVWRAPGEYCSWRQRLSTIQPALTTLFDPPLLVRFAHSPVSYGKPGHDS